jgi:hypothetical protein
MFMHRSAAIHQSRARNVPPPAAEKQVHLIVIVFPGLIRMAQNPAGRMNQKQMYLCVQILRSPAAAPWQNVRCCHPGNNPMRSNRIKYDLFLFRRYLLLQSIKIVLMKIRKGIFTGQGHDGEIRAQGRCQQGRNMSRGGEHGMNQEIRIVLPGYPFSPQQCFV